MKRFVIYDKTTGRILRTGFCQPSMVEKQTTEPNEAAIEGRGSGVLQKVVDGKIVNKTLEELEIEHIKEENQIKMRRANKLPEVKEPDATDTKTA